MPILTITVPKPQPGIGEVRELRLRFAPTRTKFLRIVNAVDLGLGRHEFYAPSPLQVRMWFEKSVSADRKLRIELEYVGESPSSPDIAWEAPSAAPVLSFWAANNQARHDALVAWKKDIAKLVHQQVQDIRGACLKSIAAETDPVRNRQKMYFCALDHATNTTFLGDQPELKDEIERAGELLVQRVLMRRTKNPQDEPKLQLDPRVLAKLSGLQIGIACAHLGKGGVIDVARFEEAYVAFASGALWSGRDWRRGEWNGRPDTAFFFLFAEFAFHAIDQGVDAAIWSELLPALVHSQQLYPLAFPPYCDTPSPRNYVPMEKRCFETYMPQDEAPHSIDSQQVNSVIDLIKETRDVGALLKAHEQNAFCAFRSTNPLPHPCDIVYGNHNSTESIDMDKWDFRSLLANMASRIGARMVPDADNKYLVVAPDGITVTAYRLPSEVPATGDGKLVGPVTMVHDVGNNVGWYRHPDRGFILVTKSKVTVVVPDMGVIPSRVDEYDMKNFDAFVVLIPK